MPYAKAKITIDAPYQRVLALLTDKVERPRKYAPTVLHSDIVKRGDDYIIREAFQQHPVPLVVMERICERDIPQGKEFLYEQLSNPDYAGVVHNVLTRVPGDSARSQVEFILDWKLHAGGVERMAAATAQAMMERDVMFLKRIAENPVVVPRLLRAYFEAVDSMQPDAMRPLLSKDCQFRFGNQVALTGADEIIPMIRQVLQSFASIKHDYVEVTSMGDRIYAETYVEYLLASKKSYILPFISVFEHRDGLLTSVKIYGDMSPIKHGWE